MRNPPRIALVSFAVLVSTAPVTIPVLALPAGADTVEGCEAAFSGATAGEITYTTDPAVRLAYSGQTVTLSGSWDPSAWDGLSSATACVRVDDVFDDLLGVSKPAPVNGGAFSHSFTIPDDTDPGSRLCTRIRLAGDPVGPATEAVWASKMHCFEVDHHEEDAPPAEEQTTGGPTAPPPTTSPVPTGSPANRPGTPDETPAGDSPVTPQGGRPPVGTPFDSGGDDPASGSGFPTPASGATPENLPLLPATGYASGDLLRHGESLLIAGLALLGLAGHPRRRLHPA